MPFRVKRPRRLIKSTALAARRLNANKAHVSRTGLRYGRNRPRLRRR